MLQEQEVRQGTFFRKPTPNVACATGAIPKGTFDLGMNTSVLIMLLMLVRIMPLEATRLAEIMKDSHRASKAPKEIQTNGRKEDCRAYPISACSRA